MDIDAMCAQIDREIEALKIRINKLEDVRNTIESLREPIEAGAYHSFKKADQQRQTESHAAPKTRKSNGPVNPPSTKRAAKDFMSAVIEKKPPIKQQITTILIGQERPMTSAEIIAALGDGIRKQTVWAALSEMAKRGILVKDKEGDAYHVKESAK
ncbi:hypothetical protein KEU06_09010 [Pseudaminobacter sp. 19-2017]|uniref:Uncharacterized protein n=1 Tax=Pseudaminobacter soli (ex Zhang et al. 2022) TaxID=2831468 RepID=A0A942DWX1_9HYPH|nr:hypothetical protein [Pseudaminobacter soli]MBS3648766.1 hypothetical protein [Pseudaminobacter soli]